jgi:hypothetical protein
MKQGLLRRFLLPLAAAGAALAFASPAAASAGPISPNQYFTGFVNGLPGEVRIAVTCDGPDDVVPFGHPVAGQTLEARQFATGESSVLPPPISNFGFTGSAGKALEVRVNGKAAALLREYEEVVEIPTNILVPCFGSSTVTFTPAPTSGTAATATVRVTFQSKF